MLSCNAKMPPPVTEQRTLGRRLHILTARLDKSAGEMLRREAGISYPRFLALYLVGHLGAETQRDLAQSLGVTEPSVSRMVVVLKREALLEVVTVPGAGHRRSLRLTEQGRRLVERWGAELEDRFAAVVEASGVPYAAYLEHTDRLLATLDAGST